MRVLIAGGRDFDDRDLLFRVLNEQHARRPLTLIIHSCAAGADRLADEWADANDVAVDAKPADRKRYGREAGSIRNAQMLAEHLDLVIIFPGKGTVDLIKKTNQGDVTVMRVRSEETS